MFFPTSRRSFLKGSLSTSALVALSGTVPQFLVRAAQGAADAKGESVLVVIQLSGGNDGLNTVVPYADDVYRKSRPILGIAAKSVLKINDYIGLHPSMDAFSKLLQQGRLGIVQGAGYPTPDRSHFSSMDIWQTAQRDVANNPVGHRATGWLGRYLDADAGREANGHHDVPALHLASGAPRLPLALVGKDIRAGSFQSIEAFRLEDGGDAGIRQAISRAVAVPRENENDLITFLHQGTASALESSRQVQEAVRTYKTDVKYPATNLARRLQTVAQLIDAGLDTRIYYLDLDGFDTHANQAVSHAALLGELSGAVSAFIADLDLHGHGKRVMAMTFSEFGRRVHENASRGTDHGAAAPMFLVGGKVKPGLLGKHPSLTDLDQGDLKFTIDFRDVYAGVLERWLGVASEPILGGKFAPMEIV
jgi:uncharacterized protein (DUF1501 family)